MRTTAISTHLCQVARSALALQVMPDVLPTSCPADDVARFSRRRYIAVPAQRLLVQYLRTQLPPCASTAMAPAPGDRSVVHAVRPAHDPLHAGGVSTELGGTRHEGGGLSGRGLSGLASPGARFDCRAVALGDRAVAEPAALVPVVLPGRPEVPRTNLLHHEVSHLRSQRGQDARRSRGRGGSSTGP